MVVETGVGNVREGSLGAGVGGDGAGRVGTILVAGTAEGRGSAILGAGMLVEICLFVFVLAGILDAVAGLDDVRLEGDGAGSAVEFEKQSAGIAEHGASFIASPQRGGGSLAVLADGLLRVVSSACS